MKRPTHITVEKAILIAARQRAVEIDANLSYVIESLLSMWLAGLVRTPLDEKACDQHPLGAVMSE